MEPSWQTGECKLFGCSVAPLRATVYSSAVEQFPLDVQ